MRSAASIKCVLAAWWRMRAVVAQRFATYYKDLVTVWRGKVLWNALAKKYEFQISWVCFQYILRTEACKSLAARNNQMKKHIGRGWEPVETKANPSDMLPGGRVSELKPFLG